jgi:PBSX family phage terminase large subunit
MATILPFGRKVYSFGTRKPKDDKRITALEGSVRSGKTWGMHLKMLLHLCTYKVGGRRVIMGESKGTIMRNILTDLFEIVGRENYRYNEQSGALTLFNSKWVVIGAGDEGAYKKIQGMTVGICYLDEATNIPKSAFQMMLTRMSPKGARVYMTLNPDHPYHWLKVEYLDNEKLKAAGQIEVIHFTMADNPNLSKEYKESVELQFTGVFYMRKILGLWVVAEGAIYRDVWMNVHLYSETPANNPQTEKPYDLRPIWLDGEGGYESRTIAIDYGTTNPTVFLDIRDTGRAIYVDREYYWDSVAKMKQKTSPEYLADLIEFIGPMSRGVKVVIDPAAAEFRLACSNAGLWVVDAENEVLEGIRHTASVLNTGAVHVNKDCTNFIREMTIYAWNESRKEVGEEEPIKKNDHAPDALRYHLFTNVPDWRISSLAMAA